MGRQSGENSVLMNACSLPLTVASRCAQEAGNSPANGYCARGSASVRAARISRLASREAGKSTIHANSAAEIGRGLLKFVKGDFDAFLESGILAHGFLRLRRTECAHEKLVAFFLSRPTPARFVLPPRSWKLTPSCRARSSSGFRSRASTTSRTPRASRSWAV